MVNLKIFTAQEENKPNPRKALSSRDVVWAIHANAEFRKLLVAHCIKKPIWQEQYLTWEMMKKYSIILW
jgi:hypothetical protein